MADVAFPVDHLLALVGIRDGERIKVGYPNMQPGPLVLVEERFARGTAKSGTYHYVFTSDEHPGKRFRFRYQTDWDGNVLSPKASETTVKCAEVQPQTVTFTRWKAVE